MMELTYQMFLEQVIDRARERHDPERPDRRQPLPRPDGRPGRVAAHASTSSSSSTGPPVTTHASRDYLAAKPKGKHGAHNYTFADVGLDEATVRATFARYVAHYGITEE